MGCVGGKRSAPEVVNVVVKHGYAPVDSPSWTRLWVHVLLVLLVVYSLVASRLSPAQVAALVSAVTSGIVATWVAARVWRAAASPDAPGGRTLVSQTFPSDQPTSGRLVCYGVPRELAALSNPDTSATEPYVPDLAWDYVPRKWALLPAGIFLICAFLRPFCSVRLEHAAFAFASAWWGLWALVRIRRTYLRVSPGHLDILRSHWWYARLVAVRSLSLRGATIVCRYDRRKLLITQMGSEGQAAYEIDLASLAAPHAFVRAVFQAALSPYIAPLLPSDALLG